VAICVEGDSHYIFATGQGGKVGPGAVNALNWLVVDVEVGVACGSATFATNFGGLKSKVGGADVEVPALNGVGIDANGDRRNGRTRWDFERFAVEYVVAGADPCARGLVCGYALAIGSGGLSLWCRGCVSSGFSVGCACRAKWTAYVAATAGG